MAAVCIAGINTLWLSGGARLQYLRPLRALPPANIAATPDDGSLWHQPDE